MYATPVTSDDLNAADVMMDGLIMDFMDDIRKMKPNFKLQNYLLK